MNDIGTLFILVTRLALGILFATAAIAKLRNRRDFYAAALAYRLLPPRLAIKLAVILPWVEAGIAIGLMAGLGIAWHAAAGLLLVYALAMAVNIARGRHDLDCGCGGPPQPLSIWLVVRNFVLAGAALAASLLPTAGRSLQPIDVLIVAGTVGVLTWLYITAHRLLAVSRASGRQQGHNATEDR